MYSVEALSIIATVLSILALIKEIIIPVLFRPKIELSCDMDDGVPYRKDCEPSIDDLLPQLALGECRRYYFYRIKVFNSSSIWTSTAASLYARILVLKKDRVQFKNFNTILMRWTTGNMYETLSRGEHLFLNLCTVVYDYGADDKEKYHLILPGHYDGLRLGLAAGFSIMKLTDGMYEYLIGIYGKSILGHQYKINIDFHSIGEKPIIKISCCKLKKVSDKNVIMEECK